MNYSGQRYVVSIKPMNNMKRILEIDSLEQLILINNQVKEKLSFTVLQFFFNKQETPIRKVTISIYLGI
jgi:hypothetical protein